jgi:hypothetical protein
MPTGPPRAHHDTGILAGWQSRLIDAYARGSGLNDAMTVAEAQDDLAASDAPPGGMTSSTARTI